MMMSQILKSVNFTKIQKSRYLKNEALFFLQIKNFINKAKKKNTLASGNADDKKNLHLGGCKFIYFQSIN